MANHLPFTARVAAWWRQHMETISTLLFFFARGLHRSQGDSPNKGPVMQSFGVFFDVSLKKLLSEILRR